MNVMCDMSQFIIVVPVTEEYSATLAETFSSGAYEIWFLSLNVINDSTPFKGAYVGMYKALDLNYDVLAKRNHKVSFVGKFHRFLNKAVTIAMEDRQRNDIFVPSGIAAGYTWNSDHIDKTDILRSIVAIDRAFRFTTDINLSALPQLTQNNDKSTIDYLILTDSNRRLSSSILKLLIEDCPTSHSKRVNNNKNVVELVVGDIVMMKTAIQIYISTNKVAKLSYQVRGSFLIVKCTGRGSYIVRNLYKPDSPEFKFIAIYLYHYLLLENRANLLIVLIIIFLNYKSVEKSLNIEIYNEIWFDKPPWTSQPLFISIIQLLLLQNLN